MCVPIDVCRAVIDYCSYGAPLILQVTKHWLYIIIKKIKNWIELNSMNSCVWAHPDIDVSVWLN